MNLTQLIEKKLFAMLRKFPAQAIKKKCGCVDSNNPAKSHQKTVATGHM
ncbi:MAG: hypothetical protein L3J18_11525 [Candidatus Brocadia sp.]|uniref:Uncharacterized protein n=1 Tax=Candidatus Brocadia fulgida TaxID=380242 RepID=A0A0M2UV67_9BACT|nr:MAG: hypothetical protein BROFUL_02401 [Candidatus Brocadia fulgida]UJS19532.1 MAG: hypothetical protein L3J18_11525 [Candidatus Brocadia sp.]